LRNGEQTHRTILDPANFEPFVDAASFGVDRLRSQAPHE